MKLLRVLLCGWWWLTGLAHAEAISVRDNVGATVRLTQPARRVVSLLPSLTESVCAVGGCDRLVATDRWSDWPVTVQRLPKVGGLDDANVELIVASKPDLVLASPSSRVAERLRALGLTVAELDAQDLPQVQHVLRTIGLLLGRAQGADQAWQHVQDQWQAAQRLVPVGARGLRVYFEVGSGPYAASESSYIGQMLERLGAANVVPKALGPFPQLNPEFVVRADPDVIMMVDHDVSELAQRPGWSSMRAVRRGHVCAIPGSAFTVIGRPGPRVGEAALALAQCLKAHEGAR
ncbi:MAG: ABC transporter substrate-binding protein [Burkholderiales bacterium]|nr:ABC transporter substrate-binding protein [Burkholderiales bacterium]